MSPAWPQSRSSSTSFVPRRARRSRSSNSSSPLLLLSPCPLGEWRARSRPAYFCVVAGCASKSRELGAERLVAGAAELDIERRVDQHLLPGEGGLKLLAHIFQVLFGDHHGQFFRMLTAARFEDHEERIRTEHAEFPALVPPHLEQKRVRRVREGCVGSNVHFSLLSAAHRLFVYIGGTAGLTMTRRFQFDQCFRDDSIVAQLTNKSAGAGGKKIAPGFVQGRPALRLGPARCH